MLRSILLVSALVLPHVLHAQPSIVREFTAKGVLLSDPMQSADGQWIIAVQHINNLQSKLVVRRVSGGDFRELSLGNGNHMRPEITPDGTRILFLSSLPRRSASDTRFYLMSAPFDKAAGVLTGAARQVTLDGVSNNFRSGPVVSHDGQRVAYVECCTTNELRVVPVTGGNSRMLAKAIAPNAGIPGWISWSADNRSLLYHVRVADTSWVRRVAVDGAQTTPVSRFIGNAGMISPDQRYMVMLAGAERNFALRIRQIDGTEVGTVALPSMRSPRFAPDGRSIVGGYPNDPGTLRVVSVENGQVRTVGSGAGDDWPDGWTDDGSAVAVFDFTNGHPAIRVKNLSGAVLRTIDLPAGATGVAVKDGRHVIFREAIPGQTDRYTLRVKDGVTGETRELARDVLAASGAGPGGHYYGWQGDEWSYRQLRDGKVQLFGVKLDGTRRLIAELPRALETGHLAYHGSRVVYKEVAGDSVRVQYVSVPKQAPRTLVTLPANMLMLGDLSWSFDGRRLGISTAGASARLYVFQFDGQGNVDGPARIMNLPFDYFYELFWLRDGSGFSVIAQPKGAPFAEVAIIRLADPERPVYLARSDSANKWGHLPSPDGKWIAYPSERIDGTVVRTVDFADLLRVASGKR